MVTTTDEIMLRVQKLSELELSELIEYIKEHLFKNKMSHLLESNEQNYIQELEDEIENLKEEINRLKDL